MLPVCWEALTNYTIPKGFHHPARQVLFLTDLLLRGLVLNQRQWEFLIALSFCQRNFSRSLQCVTIPFPTNQCVKLHQVPPVFGGKTCRSFLQIQAEEPCAGSSHLKEKLRVTCHYYIQIYLPATCWSTLLCTVMLLSLANDENF